jgi:hypothetical protein
MYLEKPKRLIIWNGGVVVTILPYYVLIRQTDATFLEEIFPF